MGTEQVTRRDTLKFAALIAVSALRFAPTSPMPSSSAHGYGRDPNLLSRSVTWSKTLGKSELATLKALVDIILPAESPHPSASEVGIEGFLDEWVSAPYPQMRADRTLILTGLAAVNEATHEQHGVRFEDAEPTSQAAIFEQLCGKLSHTRFASRLIELVCGGYYTTSEGHAAIGYVGNVALAFFLGPPSEVVRHLQISLIQLR